MLLSKNKNTSFNIRASIKAIRSRNINLFLLYFPKIFKSVINDWRSYKRCSGYINNYQRRKYLSEIIEDANEMVDKEYLESLFAEPIDNENKFFKVISLG